jgi:hypothetical protein
MFAIVAPELIPAASAAAAIGSFLAYLHFARRTEAHDARDEALALAATRAEVIVDLRRRVAALEDSRQLYAAAVAALLLELRVDLNGDPPDIERALSRINRLLDEP